MEGKTALYNCTEALSFVINLYTDITNMDMTDTPPVILNMALLSTAAQLEQLISNISQVLNMYITHKRADSQEAYILRQVIFLNDIIQTKIQNLIKQQELE